MKILGKGCPTVTAVCRIDLLLVSFKLGFSVMVVIVYSLFLWSYMDKIMENTNVSQRFSTSSMYSVAIVDMFLILSASMVLMVVKYLEVTRNTNIKIIVRSVYQYFWINFIVQIFMFVFWNVQMYRCVEISKSCDRRCLDLFYTEIILNVIYLFISPLMAVYVLSVGDFSGTPPLRLPRGLYSSSEGS